MKQVNREIFEMTDERKNEWNRIMSNPDNLILSDSLIERVDPYDLGEIENPIQVKPTCVFEFNDYTLAGEILGFSSINGLRTYTFSSLMRDASNLMNSSPFKKFSMYINNDELVSIGNEGLNNLSFNVDVQSASQAVVTISFSEVT
jgi:hypothetical protein